MRRKVPSGCLGHGQPSRSLHRRVLPLAYRRRVETQWGQSLELIPVTSPDGHSQESREINRRSLEPRPPAAMRHVGKATHLITESRPRRPRRISRPDMFSQAFDVMPERAAILDASGTILVVNEAWRRFSEENNGRGDGVGDDYGATFAAASDTRANCVAEISVGLRRVLSRASDEFAMKYAWHTFEARRWFEFRASRLADPGPARVLVTHKDVTARVERVQAWQRQYGTLLGWHEEERARLAGELHENIAQRLAGLDLAYQGVLAQHSMSGAIRDLVGDVRRMSEGLYPLALDALGLVDALRWLAVNVRRTTTKTVVFHPLEHLREMRFPRSVELAMFRFAEDVVTIAEREGAPQIDLSLDRKDARILLSARLDVRLQVLINHDEIQRIEARLQTVGGTVALDSNDRSTHLTATAPTAPPRLNDVTG